ncbi:MAG: DUF2147 domain-containing protein [Bacteroidales bacterium]|nr:DUF2147 domain-containing protein [Bacteroidales bacterium]
MKKILIFMAFALGIVGGAVAQNTLNNRADAIVGTYSGMQGSDRFRAKITKFDDGTYRAQIIWLEHDRDDKGNKILDKKNPDKSLRNIPADRIVLFSGLRYNAKEHRWDGTKIYDPQRGIRAKMTAEFMADGRLKIKGSLMGISESVYWTREK